MEPTSNYLARARKLGNSRKVPSCIERDAPALGERRPQPYFLDTAIMGRANGRKRRREQLLARFVGCGEATVEIEDDRFGHWPLEVGLRKTLA